MHPIRNRTNQILRFLSVLALAVAAALTFVSNAHALTSVGCYGVACNGQDPSTTNCLASGVLIQDQTVADVGDIYLYESPNCATAWAQLNVSPTSLAVVHGDLGQLAEIFYEPANGGVESFQATLWGGDTTKVTYSLMVPLTGSVKACGGDMGNNGFDEDPQGTRDLEQPGTANDAFLYGACTLWH